MNWLILSILSILFLVTPFERGLFFSPDLYIITFILTVLFLVWLVVISFRKNESFPMIYLGLFLLPFIYYFTFIVAESPSKNFDNLLSWLAFISFFILLLWVRGTKKIEALLPYLFSLTGASIAFFALFGVWGWVSYQDVVLGDRLTGPFQYANTFAAVLGACWIYSLICLTRQRISWYAVLIFSLPLAAYGVGFLHSYSRGALLVFPFVWLIGLLCLRTREQVLYVLYSIVSIVGSLLVFRIMVAQEQLAEVSNPGLWAFIVSTIVVMGLSMLLYYVSRSRYVEKVRHVLSNKGYFRFVLPGLVIIIGVFLWLDLQSEGTLYHQLPTSIQERLSNISLETGSAAGRTNMYADAWTMSKDAPILGLGGDGWRILFTSYQSLPYWSNEIHNGYLEVLLNTGWLGILLFMAAFLCLFGQVIYRAWMERASEDQPWVVAVIPALLMIFIHAAVDFDFSFGTVWFVIFWLFAMGVPYQPVFPSLGRFEFKGLLSYKRLIAVRRALKVILALGVFIGGIYSYRFYLAETAVVQAGNSMSVNEGLRIFENAASRNSYNVDYWLKLAHVYAESYRHSQQEADRVKVIEALDQVEKLEPNNPTALYNVALVYKGINESQGAVDYMDKAIALDRFNVEFYNAVLSYKFQLAEQKLNNDGNQQAALELAASAIEDYEAYREWYAEWKDVQVPDRRSLNIDKQAHFIAVDSYRMLNLYAKALEVYKSQGVVIDEVLYDAKKDKLLDKPFEVLTLSEVISNNLDNIIVLSAMDEASSHLSPESKSLLGNLGSHISELGFRGSYVSVIADGRVIFDKVSNEGSIEINQDSTQELNSIFLNKPFVIHSSGLNFGNRSSILVDGVEYSKNGRGINIAVFDKEMKPIDTYHFDTYVSDLRVIPLDE